MEIRNSDKWSRAEFTRDFGCNQIDGLTDEVTFGQLASICYELDSRGSTMIESKDKAPSVRNRGVRRGSVVHLLQEGKIEEAIAGEVDMSGGRRENPHRLFSELALLLAALAHVSAHLDAQSKSG
jgi:hypothetical protein